MRFCILCLMSIVLVACQAKPAPHVRAGGRSAPPATASAQRAAPDEDGAFDSVRIESHLKDWGYAHKTVTADGTIIGAHLSGGPQAVRVYQTEGRISAADLAALRHHIATIQHSASVQAVIVDQKSESYWSVIIVLAGQRRTIEFHATETPKFPFADVQAIWDILARYRVGAW